MRYRAVDGTVRLNLVYYGKHTPDIDSRMLALRPRYIIANTPHGLWGEVNGHGADWLLRDAGAFRNRGTGVIGYITAGYEGTGSGGSLGPEWYNLDTNLRLIRNMAEQDCISGVFIDECSRFPDVKSRGYLKELADLAHSYGLLVWGNVGHDRFDDWFFEQGGFDLMHSSEEWQGQELTPEQRRWAHRISVTGSSPLYSVKDAFRLIKDAWDKGIAYAYVSNRSYVQTPTWLNELGAMLRG